MFNLMGKKIIPILHSNNCLSSPILNLLICLFILIKPKHGTKMSLIHCKVIQLCVFRCQRVVEMLLILCYLCFQVSKGRGNVVDPMLLVFSDVKKSWKFC